MTIVRRNLHFFRVVHSICSMLMSRNYSVCLQSFISSTKSFQILNLSSRPLSSETLYILDSSFNPPTRAHLALSLCSLPTQRPSTVVLLLSIENADKLSKPASFDHRLEMMELLAKRIERFKQEVGALVALSKRPKFVDKAKDVIEAFPKVQEVDWLVGYDTLIRILDKKYYTDSLENSLSAFWEKNRLICAMRGDETVERAYLDTIRAGMVDGVPKSWARYIKIIDPVGKEHSSTRARKAVCKGELEELARVVPEDIAEYIRSKNLYREE